MAERERARTMRSPPRVAGLADLNVCPEAAKGQPRREWLLLISVQSAHLSRPPLRGELPLLFFWRSSRQRGWIGRANGILMDPYTVDFHAAFSLLLRFILLIKSPKYQSPNISRLNRPEETRKISLLKTFLRSLLSRFSPISSTWSSTRKRDVSKLRGIGHGGWDFAVNGVWNVAFTPFFGPRFHSHSRPNSRFEGPLSSRNEFLPAP